MKKLLSAMILAVSFTSSVMAGEYQMITGEEAYQLYKTLPGKACQEYRLATYVVYSKYQTNSCTENQTDESKWNCTVQFAVKNGKLSNVISADCSRVLP